VMQGGQTREGFEDVDVSGDHVPALVSRELENSVTGPGRDGLVPVDRCGPSSGCGHCWPAWVRSPPGGVSAFDRPQQVVPAARGDEV
jgi:hypothetical protein